MGELECLGTDECRRHCETLRDEGIPVEYVDGTCNVPAMFEPGEVPVLILDVAGRLRNRGEVAAAAGGLYKVLVEHAQSELSAEVRNWAADDINHGLDRWRQRARGIIPDIPASLQELVANAPNLDATLTRLHKAKQALTTSDAQVPEGENGEPRRNLGDTMHLVLVPWQAMRDNLPTFSEWLFRLRASQDSTFREDSLPPNLKAIIQQNGPLYRDPDNPSRRLTPGDYLDKKISQDGPWGVMLLQVSQPAGIDFNSMPDFDEWPDANTLTNDGNDHFKIAGQPVDAMGIFESLALTLQIADLKTFFRKTYDSHYCLLANRIDVDGRPNVVVTTGHNGNPLEIPYVMSSLHPAHFPYGHIPPRLAVV